MAAGPVMLDLAGVQLGDDERSLLLHPLVGGVILFSRNFESAAQLSALTAQIHGLRPSLLVATDQEGGRVQRFRNGFTSLPPMRTMGSAWDRQPQQGRTLAHAAGLVLALELRACGVDFSFTPVLDLDYGTSEVIGDRAFHRDADTVTELSAALISGLRDGGMANVGKHFPGHGFVAADSHHAVPIDSRRLEEIGPDLLPYRAHRHTGLLAVMPAHVIYERLDSRPAGFSRFWLHDMLRGEVGFDGAVFSDDLCMEGASVAGDIVERAQAAAWAGCDMVLVCNKPDAARELLGRWQPAENPGRALRLEALRPRGPTPALATLAQRPDYRSARAALDALAVME